MGYQPCPCKNDFSALFDRLYHPMLLIKLSNVTVGGILVYLNAITGSVGDRGQRVLVDGKRNGDFSIVSCVPQTSVIGHLLYTSDVQAILENTIVDSAVHNSL